MADSEARPSGILYVYDTRYSSWGAWSALVISHFRIPYAVELCTMTNPERAPPARFAGGLLPLPQPAPVDEDFVVRDSLAVCEFLAQQ